MKLAVLERILECVDQKEPIVLATDLDTGAQQLLQRGEGRDEGERALVQTALSLDESVTDETQPPQRFYQPFNPPLRMILVGAVHIAQPLSAIAMLAGYEVTIVDPRAAFASKERFLGVRLDRRWPGEALEALQLDRRCALITLTHDPKLDDPALGAALRSDAFFIGCLGSTKTHAARLRRLAQQGFSEAELQRLHGPVGLPIGSRSPVEIAVSALAQVIQTLRKPSA